MRTESEVFTIPIRTADIVTFVLFCFVLSLFYWFLLVLQHPGDSGRRSFDDQKWGESYSVNISTDEGVLLL